MGIRGATIFDVGFRCFPSIPLISSGVCSLIAFLTAKSLPLGAERDPGEGISKHLFYKDGVAIPLAQVSFEDNEWVGMVDALRPYYQWQLEKSAAAWGRVYSAIGATPENQIFFTCLEELLYRFDPSAPQMQYRVLYNPAFCVSKFFALFKDAKLDVLRDGGAKLDRARLGRVLPFFLMIIAFAFAVEDVAIGAVMRVLQAPYYVLMFLWHARARDFDVGIIHGLYGFGKKGESQGPVFGKKGEFQGSVFGAMDKAFTCFAVLLNSIVLGLVFYIHSGVLGVGAFEVNVLCGALAVLTLVAVSLTAFNMQATNQGLRREAQNMINVLGGDRLLAPLYRLVETTIIVRSASDYEVADTAPALSAASKGSPAAVVADNSDLSVAGDKVVGARMAVPPWLYLREIASDIYLPFHECRVSGKAIPPYRVVDCDPEQGEAWRARRAVVESNARMIAHLLYLNEIGRGAYLPSHFRAGFGGTTAFSFVEEVLHAPLHWLASAAITLVERCFGDKGSHPSAENTVSLVEQGFGDKALPPSAENTVTLVERCFGDKGSHPSAENTVSLVEQGFGDKASPPSAENTTIVVAQSEQRTGRGCRFPLL